MCETNPRYLKVDRCHSLIKMLKKSINGTPYIYDNSTLSSSIEILGLWVSSQKPRLEKFFMAFISKVIKKRISKLICRFDVPKIPPHMINQLGVEKEATSTY